MTSLTSGFTQRNSILHGVWGEVQHVSQSPAAGD